MAAVAKWYADLAGTLTSGGTSTAYTLTTNSNHQALGDLSPLVFKANVACGASPTLTVDGLGAKTLKKYGNADLIADDIRADQTIVVVYNSTSDVFEVISHINTLGTQTIWVPAAAMIPTVSNGCASLLRTETTAGRPDVQGLAFDTSSDEFAQFLVTFPNSWDEGTITYEVVWTALAGGAGGVAWQLQGVALADNDSMDTAYGTAVVVTDTSHETAEDVQVTDVSGAVTIAGAPSTSELVAFRFGRDVSDAADTLAEDATVLGIKILMITDSVSD
jgi:hypothetical protein